MTIDLTHRLTRDWQQGKQIKREIDHRNTWLINGIIHSRHHNTAQKIILNPDGCSPVIEIIDKTTGDITTTCIIIVHREKAEDLQTTITNILLNPRM